MGRFIMSCSIGTGAGVQAYKRSIKPLIRIASGINKGEVMNRNGWARELAFAISRTVNRHPQAGISPHFHAVVVRRGKVSTWNNDETVHYPDGRAVQIQMPRVARSYDEFLAMSHGAESGGNCAVC